jgi:hypothetical protein
MRGLHLWAGVLGVVAFLVTGQFMRHHQPPMDTLSESVRLMHRSRHIYILASGLVNLMLGLYVRPQFSRWRRVMQSIGSALLVSSTAMLILAFIEEPDMGFQPEMWWSHLGLYALFAGCMVHVASAIGGPG